jgi:hypothetical protein
MKARVGDRLVIRGHANGTKERHATIVDVRGPDGAPPYVVRWADEPDGVAKDHLFFPGSDADIESLVDTDGPDG